MNKQNLLRLASIARNVDGGDRELIIGLVIKVALAEDKEFDQTKFRELCQPCYSHSEFMRLQDLVDKF